MRSKLAISISLALLVLFTCATMAQCKIVYVRTDGSDSNDGSTWTLAKKTIQAGINATVSGDEIWVAKGVYIECIRLNPGTGLYGGFIGNEVNKYQRQITTNITTIDGNQTYAVVTVPSGATTTTVIDGFTIKNGCGGIYCSYTTYPTISNNIIVDNLSDYGGGIYCGYTSSPPIIINNTIKANTAYYGGGIYCDHSSPNISNNIITENHAAHYDGEGGGICCDDSFSPNISNNNITKNYAAYGGGISCNYSSSPNISNNTIAENNSESGGGISCYQSFPTISGNIITGNTAFRYDSTGGGIYCLSSSPSISNNIIKKNRTFLRGGGISCEYLSSPNISNNIITGNTANSGGGVSCYKSSPVTSGNTITENSATIDGGGIYCSLSSPDISNNIVAFNSSGIYGDGTSTLHNNCIYNPSGYNYSGLSAGIGDISTNPLFLASQFGDYRLRPNSPCIGTGYNTAVQAGSTDLEGKPRIFPANGTVDIGCYEYDTTPYTIQKLTQAKAIPEQFTIKLQGKPITASFSDAFYVEEPDKLSGLRVISAQTVTPGDLATVTGHLTIDNGERALQADSVVTTSGNTANIPGALFVSNKFVGGGNYFWNYNNENCGQQGITDTFGLNNIGLLIKITGKFTWVSDNEFTVNDGSGVSIKCTVPSTVTLNPSWAYISVTGISSCEGNGTELHRLLRVRQQNDIVAY